MIGYSERAAFSARSAEVYRAARALVSRVVSHLDREGREIRCHELARAVAKHLVRQGYELLVVDGVLGCADHTWIELSRTRAILDVYTPGRLPVVQLVDDCQVLTGNGRPAYAARGAPRTDIREEVVEALFLAMAPEVDGPVVVLSTLPSQFDGPGVWRLEAAEGGDDGGAWFGLVPAGRRVVLRGHAWCRPGSDAVQIRECTRSYRVTPQGLVIEPYLFWLHRVDVGGVSVVEDTYLEAFAPGQLVRRVWLQMPCVDVGSFLDVSIDVTNEGPDPAAFELALRLAPSTLDMVRIVPPIRGGAMGELVPPRSVDCGAAR
jgi:hypothetical protein